MTLYINYYPVDSPLNEELGPLIQIRRRDLQSDPIHRRMLLILVSVVLTVLAFAMLMLPGRASSEPAALPAAQTNLAPPEIKAPPEGAISPIFSPEVQHWTPSIMKWSEESGIDPDIVATIMQIESCGDPKAASYAGAQGLFQVMPFHFEHGEDMLDPATNAMRGLNYYNQQLRETSGNVFLSFAGYNGGSAASSSSWDNWAHETQRYYVWSKGIYEEAKAGMMTSPTLQRWMEAGGASLCAQAANRLALE